MVATVIGETLDQKYRILRLLDAGGMGSVYEAERTGTGERVAVKLIQTEKLRSGSEAAVRFRREAQAASAIHSPHVVRILDSGTDEATGNLYIVMEYLAGEDLRTLVDRVGPLPPGVALRIAGQALLGLQKAHETGVVHRDIKPANLFLARRGTGEIELVIVDFGIAKIRADASIVPHATGLTTTGSFLGSPLFMSPEQVQNSKDVDHRTDIWSLGTALYCALAGRAPHQDVAFPGKLIVTICAAPAPPLQQRAPWVAPEIAEVVHRALAIDPGQRWPSAAAMLDAIRLLAPDGFSLREDMLTGVGTEQRASVAPMAPAGRGHIVVNGGAIDTVVENETVASLEHATTVTATGGKEKPRPGGAIAPRTERSRGLRVAGAALALGVGVAGAYRLLRTPMPISAPIAGTPASVAPPRSSPEPTAVERAPAGQPERVSRSGLEVSPAGTAAEAHGVPVEVRDGGVAALGRLGNAHEARVVELPHEVDPRPQRAVPAREAVSSPAPAAPPSTPAPAAPSLRKPEDSLMPPLPP